MSAVALIFAMLVALRLRQRRCEKQHCVRTALREVQCDPEVRIAQRAAELTFADIALTSKVEAFNAA